MALLSVRGDLSLEDGDPGELLALQELQAGATTGRDVTEGGFVEAEPAHGGRRVAATDDRQAGDLGEGLRDGAGALGEGIGLEDPHRAVPEDRLRVGQGRGEGATGLGADVEAEAVRGD